MSDVEIIILLFFIGIAVSTLASMVGLGGGVLFIPILILIFQLDPDKTVGTSVFCMTLTTFSATIGYWRHKCVNVKLGLAYDIFDIPGIILGAWLTEILPGYVLEIACGIAVSLLALMVIFKKNSKSSEKTSQTKTNNQSCDIPAESSPNPQKYDFSFAFKGQNLKWVVISSFLGGLMTGMVGLGGGTVDTTTMILLGVPVQMAAGSSSFAMLITNAFGFGTHALLGNVDWFYAIPMGLGALIGAQLGSNWATKVDSNILRKILGAVALYTGIQLLLP